MLVIRPETPLDVPAREALLDRCFGVGRLAKTSERLREGRLPAADLSYSVDLGGLLVATLRFWHVSAGPDRPALLLGPLAVDPALQGSGIGAALIRHGLDRAAAAGHAAVLLVGDEPYYRRFGFARSAVAALTLPGPFAPERFLGLEFVPGALMGTAGLVLPTGIEAVADEGQERDRRRSDVVPAALQAA